MWQFNSILDLFSKDKSYLTLTDSKHGLERECLRIDKNGFLTQTDHPESLGSALKNPLITTDFTEAQLELVTPTCKTEQETISFLHNLHLFVIRNLKNELLWPFSMPCLLPKENKIPLAQYGNSFNGKTKTLYRLGLGHRYGRKMQTVSGIHYNFSFSDKFWNILYENFGKPKENKQDFVSRSYLHLIRNFLRFSWLNTYLFGASPVLDKSYLKKKPSYLKKLSTKTYYGEYACSFRMSELGYYSKVQSQLAVSFNSLKQYLKDLGYAVSTPSPKYKKLPGLNQNILQLESEHYSRIRPKQLLSDNERPLEALAKRGILYVEARAVDINPYSPIGVSADQLCFLHVFLIYCLFKPGPHIHKKEHTIITGNQNKVALFGRHPRLTLNKSGMKIDMHSWAKEILSEMQKITPLLDKNCTKSLETQINKIFNPELTPSAQILHDLQKNKKSFMEFGLNLAQKHCQIFKKEKLNPSVQKKFEHIAEESLKNQKNQEIKDETYTAGYEDLEFSTQILIKEALKRKIKVEILDRPANFIRLSKGWKAEYIKQATKTSRDSYMTYLIMKNKNVTNQILKSTGFHIPSGETFNTLEAALSAYEKFSKIKVVIKPTTANHGIGISFINPGNHKAYKIGVELAFKNARNILIEEFMTGEEYRLLIIDYKTVSIIKRLPANVVGDGIHSIKELIDIKNYDPKYYKFMENYNIGMGYIESEFLKYQGLNFKTNPPKGQRVFLRANSNVGTGGDPIECFDQVHKNYKSLAEKAAKTVNARICGVDMIIKNPKGEADNSNYAIIELNYNPSLHMHHYTVDSKGVNVAGKVLDLLEF